LAGSRGGPIHWQLDCIPLMEGRRARALLLVVTDLTARTRAMRSLNEQRRRLAHQATHDPLTGLGNRHALLEVLQTRLDGPTPPEVLLLDLDQFKEINDRYGHAAGDHVLKVVADRLAQAVRRAEMVARFGGDEFVIVLRPGGDAEAVAPRLAAVIAEPIHWEGRLLVVSGSVGWAVGDPDDTPHSLVERADKSMYRTKGTHRGPSGGAW
jgi:diguanylate cyclase (GGDEF)-like protein